MSSSLLSICASRYLSTGSNNRNAKSSWAFTGAGAVTGAGAGAGAGAVHLPYESPFGYELDSFFWPWWAPR